MYKTGRFLSPLKTLDIANNEQIIV